MDARFLENELSNLGEQTGNVVIHINMMCRATFHLNLLGDLDQDVCVSGESFTSTSGKEPRPKKT